LAVDVQLAVVYSTPRAHWTQSAQLLSESPEQARSSYWEEEQELQAWQSVFFDPEHEAARYFPSEQEPHAAHWVSEITFPDESA
jgi:hypothetical protein